MVLRRKTTFPSEKVGFGVKNHLFPRKKMVLGRTANFILGKSWFWTGKPTFPSENQKNQHPWTLAA